MEMQNFQEIFLRGLKGPLADLLGLKSQAIVSQYLDQSPIQDSLRYRTKYLGLRIASLLINETGELNRELLGELNRLLSEGSFILGPGREGDAFIYAHVKNCLKRLDSDPEIWMAIRRFSPPLCHKGAEGIVRETLWPEPIRALQTVHVRKAVVAAWLTLLRQTTGSCFATAPAILIQAREPLRFFKDLYDLLSTGQMKRTVAGKEYSVPLSFSSGMGDLQKNSPFLEHSFGIAIALESVGLKLTGEMQREIRELGPQTPESLLRILLMKEAGLTEEDLQDEEHLSRIQMTQLVARQGSVYYQRPSARAQKVAEWKKKFETACVAFKTVTECALLRSWEYSMASFCDVKTEFARWNLFIGLGLHPDQKNGIGAFLYEQVNGHLQKCHLEIEKISKEYEQEISAMQAIEVMIRGASSEVRLNQLKAEYTSHHLSANTLAEMRDRLLAKTESLVHLFSWLIAQYDQKLQEFFQELFDPVLIGEGEHFYDDSPAGFRLVYKHGRRDASQWTAIHNEEQYKECLRDFFSRIENELDPPPHIGKELIAEITTALIQFIQEPAFLEWAIARSKEKGRKSPWDYISGGTLQSLLMSYCNRAEPFTEESVVPHSAEELLQFLALKKQKDPLLMHSPTHAFIFHPLERSRLKAQMSQKWDDPMQEYLVHKLSERLPEEERALFIHLMRQKETAETNHLFRSHLLEVLGPRIKNKEALVDSVLYEQQYLLLQGEAQDAVYQILKSLGKHESVQLEGNFFGPYDLYERAKMAILQSVGGAISPIDWDMKIAETMRQLGFLPDALLFGDTNWSGWSFGFVLNPVTGHMELWRLNRTATQGFPMSDWKQWAGPQNTFSWVLLSEPREYNF